MKILTHSATVAACVWGAVAPLQAETSPQEIFTRLSAPAQPAVMAPELRAERLPSLALLPVDADMVVAAVAPGKITLELMRLLGDTPPEGLEKQLSSIHDAAFLAGEGSAEALAEALPMLAQASQLETLSRVEAWWCERARPEYVDTIRTVFRHRRALAKQNIMDALESFHPAPVYYVITAEPGHEEEFAAMQRELEECMRRAVEKDDSLQYEEIDGFSGLRVTWLHVYKWLMKSEPQDDELRRGLAQRELHFLTRSQQGVAGFFLCTHPAEIQLPRTPAESMLNSPKLAEADAHMRHLLAAGWMSTALNRAVRFCMQSDRRPVALAVADVLLHIGGQEPTQEPVYNKAASSVMWFVGQPPYFDEINTPMSMQVWQQGDEVYMESVSDAQGMEFGQGALQLVQQAAAPDVFFYMESTSFSAPYTPVFARYWNKCFASALSAARGIALTLREEYRAESDTYVRYAGLFMPEVQALGASLNTVAAGLAAPFALVAACPAGGEEPNAALAFFSAVKNRGALAQGWQEMLSAIGGAVGKLGVPAGILSAWPITSHRLAGGAVSYAPTLPFSSSMVPKVAVSDSHFAMGNSAALNARLMAGATGHMPFCGAVNSVDFPGLAAAVRGEDWHCGKYRVADVLKRLGEKVKRLYSVSTINSGVRTARGLLLMQPPAQR